MLQRVPLRAGNILNINVPDIPLAEIKGFRITRCGSRHASQHVYTQTDPKGNTLLLDRASWRKKNDVGPDTDFCSG